MSELLFDERGAAKKLISTCESKLAQVNWQITEYTARLYHADALGLIFSRAGLAAGPRAVTNETDQSGELTEITESSIKELWINKRKLEAQLAALEKFISGSKDDELDAQLNDLRARCLALATGSDPG